MQLNIQVEVLTPAEQLIVLEPTKSPIISVRIVVGKSNLYHPHNHVVSGRIISNASWPNFCRYKPKPCNCSYVVYYSLQLGRYSYQLQCYSNAWYTFNFIVHNYHNSYDS